MNDQLEITLDLETIPSQDPTLLDAIRADLKDNFKAPSDMTKERACRELGMTDPSEVKFTSKESAIEKWVARFRDEKLEETAQETLKKTSFDGAKGQICVFGVSIDGREPAPVWFPNWQDADNERRVIVETFDYIADSFSACNMRNPLFIGHNIAAFDLPFLFKRCVILGIKPPAVVLSAMRAKPWDDCIFDTMKRWDAQNSIKLDALCKALGLPGKTEGIDGSMVWPMVQNNEIGLVAAYCMDDIDAAYRAYRKMTFQSVPTTDLALVDDMPEFALA